MLGFFGGQVGAETASGVKTFAELDDVSIGNPQNGDHLSFDFATQVWKAAAPEAGAGTVVYDLIASLPLSNVEPGTMALVQENSAIYAWIGTTQSGGWYKIATVNLAPTISQGIDPEYDLPTTGSIELTLVAADPEGLPLTWDYNVSVGNESLLNITSDDAGTFTVGPSQAAIDTETGGTFTISFSASDGVNITSDTAEFTLSFVLGVRHVFASFNTVIGDVDIAADPATVTNNDIDLSATAQHLAYSSVYSRLFVAVAYAPFVIQYDTTTGTPTQMGTIDIPPVNTTRGIGVSPDGTKLYVYGDSDSYGYTITAQGLTQDWMDPSTVHNKTPSTVRDGAFVVVGRNVSSNGCAVFDTSSGALTAYLSTAYTRSIASFADRVVVPQGDSVGSRIDFFRLDQDGLEVDSWSDTSKVFNGGEVRWSPDGRFVAIVPLDTAHSELKPHVLYMGEDGLQTPTDITASIPNIATVAEGGVYRAIAFASDSSKLFVGREADDGRGFIGAYNISGTTFTVDATDYSAVTSQPWYIVTD